ncbi:MAG TPA: hypothetical protein VG253_19625 [Streptosporangiaceae bacterium]|jgi:hypothetical protein|nr:hypothetical protein [Streptosporangiaceae bacterium]
MRAAAARPYGPAHPDSALSRTDRIDQKCSPVWKMAPAAVLAAGPKGDGAGRATCLEPFRGCLQARFEEDKHVQVSVLLRELVDARFDQLCPTLALRDPAPGVAVGGLVCPHRRGQDVTVEIDHPPGEEIQWDWLELHHTPR